ncbi:hypothetical protein SAMN02745121_08750 [Nannocystis exedens]|uniref:Uncharacterized protein n=1 Tax=Nannocystis exedens TaxID=54 RepID=A0A1I2II29_9BACT|nr:hypothetical protein [Nannocystis exedens]PCC72536.1 hypothetical protein NAEX_05616 [Nannocystis exedens]SFF42032.1 hypothetical protein SAMN02745121_08750 [Nannocystis exedens]
MPALPLALALVAAFAPAGLDLEWQAPEGCPPAAEVAAATSKLLGRPLDPGGPAERVRARARVVREPRGFRLDLELQSPAGSERRSLRDRRCQVLADAAAEIVATAVDPSLAAGVPPALPPESDGTWPEEPAPSDINQSTLQSASAPAPPPAPAPAPAAAPAPVAADDPLAAPLAAHARADDPLDGPTPPPAPAPPPDPWRASLRLASVFDQGSLSGPTGGFAVALGVMRRRFRVELGAAGLAPRETRPDPTLAAGARLSLWTATLRACGVAGIRPRLELVGCGGLEAGALLGAGLGVEGARTRAQPWFAVVVGPELAVPLTRGVAVTLGADAVVPVVRPLFVLDGVGPVFRANPAAFRAVLGVQLRIP